MSTELALSGTSESDRKIDTRLFARAFVAGLAQRNYQEVRPNDSRDRRGFYDVVSVLDRWIDDLEERQFDRSAIRQLVRISNDLRPSNSGGFEGFESALRALQTTLSGSPNPSYDEIEFTVTRGRAELVMEELSDWQRQLVEEAINAYLRQTSL